MYSSTPTERKISFLLIAFSTRRVRRFSRCRSMWAIYRGWREDAHEYELTRPYKCLYMEVEWRGVRTLREWEILKAWLQWIRKLLRFFICIVSTGRREVWLNMIAIKSRNVEQDKISCLRRYFVHFLSCFCLALKQYKKFMYVISFCLSTLVCHSRLLVKALQYQFFFYEETPELRYMDSSAAM